MQEDLLEYPTAQYPESIGSTQALTGGHSAYRFVMTTL